MTRRLRTAFGGGGNRQAADTAVGRGLADVLAALDNIIDDDAALGRIYAGRTVHPKVTAPPATPIVPGRAATRRRPALRLVVAAAAALSAAVVALAVTELPGAPDKGAAEPAVNTADVVHRVDSALTAADPGAMAQMTVTTRGGTGTGGQRLTSTTQEWSYGDQWRAITYSAAGHLLDDEGFSRSGYTAVNYEARTWARQPGPSGPAPRTTSPRGCEPAVAALPLTIQPQLPGGPPGGVQPATVAKDLRAAISCGVLTDAGRQRIDGTAAIELTSTAGSPISETIWVSPSTYLPVQLVVRPGAPSGQPGIWQTADITWLRPTARNLASLAVPVPAGYRQVPFAEVIRPLMRAVPG